MKAPGRFVVVVLIRGTALFFSAWADSSATALEISQPVPAQNLQASARQVSSEEKVRLPALGAEEHSQKTKTESQLSAKDTWGQGLLTEFAGVLIAAGEGLNSDHGPTMLSAVTRQTRRRVRRRVARKVAASTQGWLRRYGQASVSFAGDGDKNFSWHVDYSQPVYQSRKDTFLFEASGRYESEHHLVGSGLVYRRGWRRGQLVGMNLFIDHCLVTFGQSTNAHQRGSVGVEWKTPRWRVDANGYMPLSDWKTIDHSTSSDSSTHSDTLWRHSRPAGGIDVTVQANLAYAPLSIKAGYSRWFGDAVGLTKQGSPSSALGHGNTLGVVWQPISLLKLSINHTFAPEGQQNDWFRAELHFNLGKSVRGNFRRTDTQSARTRWRAVPYQFVNRNREMVLAFSERILKAGPDVTKELCRNPNSDCSFIQAATGDNGGKVTYSSSNPEVAKVEINTGRVTLVGPGTTRITATEAATGKHKAQSNSYMLTVVAKVSPPLQLDCDGKGPCLNPYRVIYDDNLITTVAVSGEGQGKVRCDVDESDVAICSESNGVWQIQPQKVGATKITFVKTWEDSETEMARASFTYQIDKGSNALTLKCDGKNCGSTHNVTYADGLTTKVQVSGGNQGKIECNVDDSIATCSGSGNNWKVMPIKVGTTPITFTETADNFETAKASFTYKIDKGSNSITLKCDGDDCGDTHSVTYADDRTTKVQVSGGNQGKIECNVDDSIATCSGSGNNWKVMPIKVGTTPITFTETADNFETAQASFTYKIDKGSNSITLMCDNRTCGKDYRVTYADDLTTQVQVSGGNKGKIACQVTEETVATCSGSDNNWKVQPKKAGKTNITFTDTKDNFEPAQASFNYQINKGSNPLTLKCGGNGECGEEYQVTYADDLTTQVQVSGGNKGKIACQVTEETVATCSGSDNNWKVQPKKAGKTNITFTDTKDNFEPAQASFNYQINKGSNPLTLKCGGNGECGEEYQVTYADDLTTQVQVSGGNKGKIACQVTEETVATCSGSDNNWKVQPKKAGKTNITFTDTKDNFEPAQASFNYQINKGSNPLTLKCGGNGECGEEYQVTYADDLTTQVQVSGGNKGKIVCEVEKDGVATCSKSNNNNWQVTPTKVGTTKITFTDTKDNFEPAQASFNYQINKGSNSITLKCDGNNDCGDTYSVTYADDRTTKVQVSGGKKGKIACQVTEETVATCSGSDNNWKVQPKKAGKTNITFTDTKNNFETAEASFSYEVAKGKCKTSLSIGSDKDVNIGQTYEHNPTVGNGEKIVWSSNPEATATIDNSGKVTALQRGECTIRGKQAATEKWLEEEDSYKLSVKGGKLSVTIDWSK